MNIIKPIQLAVYGSWATVTPPRMMTIASVIYYVVSALLGVVYITSPATLVYPLSPADWTPIAAAVLLLTGGAVGSQACWRGVWSVETVSVVNTSSGVLLAGLDTLHRLSIHGANVYLQVMVGGLTILAALLGIVRFAYIWHRQEQPKEGVTLPVDLARQKYEEIRGALG